MERVKYEINTSDDRTWETSNRDEARAAFRKGFQVIEHREIVSIIENTVVRVIISVQLTISNF